MLAMDAEEDVSRIGAAILDVFAIVSGAVSRAFKTLRTIIPFPPCPPVEDVFMSLKAMALATFVINGKT